MIVLIPSTSIAVDFASIPVSSFVVILGMGVSKSPSTRSFIRFAQAFIGRLMLLARTRATTLEIKIERMITAILTAIPA